MEQVFSRDEIRTRLESFLRRIGGKKKVISEKTLVLQDLGIGGDDAGELLDEIHASFGTRFDGFEFDLYFPNETEALGEHYARLLGFKSRRKPLPVGHLVSVIEHGQWFEPEADIPAMRRLP